jgi:IS30 family transposase
MSVPRIAERLGRHRSTIHREIRRNWHDDGPAWAATSRKPPRRAPIGGEFTGASCTRIRI